MLINQLRVPILIGALLLLYLSCTSISKPNASKSSILNLDWLLGEWIRNNESQGRTTYETWNKTGGLYYGIGVTISSSGDTIFREDLRVVNSNGNWILEVSGVNERPTEFTIQEYGKASFSVENIDNEFPKFMTYWKESNQLNAKIYNDSSSAINFSFDRLKNQ